MSGQTIHRHGKQECGVGNDAPSPALIFINMIYRKGFECRFCWYEPEGVDRDLAGIVKSAGQKP